MISGGNVGEIRGHRQSRNATIWRVCARGFRRGCPCAWKSQNVIRLTDIKLKYPFWEFAASRVADLQRCFPPSWRFLLFFFPIRCLPLRFVLSPSTAPCLHVHYLPGCCDGKNRIFSVTLSKGQASRWGDKLERWCVW